MPAVALVLGNPVPHGALREACVGLLLACGSVGDLQYFLTLSNILKM